MARIIAILMGAAALTLLGAGCSADLDVDGAETNKQTNTGQPAPGGIIELRNQVDQPLTTLA